MIENNEKSIILLAEEGGKPIGCGLGEIKKNPDCYKSEQYGYIGFMYVAKSARGKGVAQKIIKNLIDWLKTKKVVEVRLKLYPQNTAALKTYQKAGFDDYILEMRKEIT